MLELGYLASIVKFWNMCFLYTESCWSMGLHLHVSSEEQSWISLQKMSWVARTLNKLHDKLLHHSTVCFVFQSQVTWLLVVKKVCWLSNCLFEDSEVVQFLELWVIAYLGFGTCTKDICEKIGHHLSYLLKTKFTWYFYRVEKHEKVRITK